MQTNYDAIVIGSGISCGWTAKERCEQGLKTLVQERGRNEEHNKDYPTAIMQPWDFKHRGRMTKAHRDANPLIAKVAGKDPKTSLLNANNQLHLCPNVFVTDGACMTSTGNQSPNILYMALTTRAATFVVGEAKAGRL